MVWAVGSGPANFGRDIARNHHTDQIVVAALIAGLINSRNPIIVFFAGGHGEVGEPFLTACNQSIADEAEYAIRHFTAVHLITLEVGV